MVEELLASALAAVEHSKPEVRAAALLRIARVQTTIDRTQARTTFEQGLDEVRRIPGPDGAFLLQHARTFAAAIAPDLLPSIVSQQFMPRHFEADHLGSIMIEHGHLQAALEFVIRYDDASTFPFSMANRLTQLVDADAGLAIVRRAVAAWREAHAEAFVPLFQQRWKLLPEEESRDIVREIVRATLDEPDKPTQATYGDEGRVRITSFREHTLFLILHILRHLDAPLLETLLSSHPQFAAAARRFPYGTESILHEAEERRKSAGERRTGFAIVGNPAEFPYVMALHDGDFEQAMSHAQQEYQRDAAPEDRNLVPVEFWPSTGRFRGVVYAAGKQLGPSARAYLTRIEDPDIRVLAEIEFAAALAGLPEFPGIRREYRPRRVPPPGPEPRP